MENFLEAGFYYKTRSGDVVGPLEAYEGAKHYRWIIFSCFAYTDEGKVDLDTNTQHDLVEKLTKERPNGIDVC